jgi:hypothetical protein
VRATLRTFCVELNNVLNVDEESHLLPELPPPQPPPPPSTPTEGKPQVQVQIHPPPDNVKPGPSKTPGKRKDPPAKGQSGGKRKKLNKELLGADEEQEVSNTLPLLLPEIFLANNRWN